MQQLLGILFINAMMNFGQEPSVPTGAAMTERGTSVLASLDHADADTRFDIMLTLNPNPVVNDLSASILPIPDQQDDPAQMRRYEEIRALVGKQSDVKFSSTPDGELATDLIQPSAFIKQPGFQDYRIRLTVAKGELVQAVALLRSVHPAVSLVDIEPLQNMLLDKSAPLPTDVCHQIGAGPVFVSGTANDVWIKENPNIRLLGNAGGGIILMLNCGGAKDLMAIAEKEQRVVRPATLQELKSVGRKATISLTRDWDAARLNQICPAASIESRTGNQVCLIVNDAELAALRNAGANVQ